VHSSNKLERVERGPNLDSYVEPSRGQNRIGSRVLRSDLSEMLVFGWDRLETAVSRLSSRYHMHMENRYKRNYHINSSTLCQFFPTFDKKRSVIYNHLTYVETSVSENILIFGNYSGRSWHRASNLVIIEYRCG
jgi:hypothetical protein